MSLDRALESLLFRRSIREAFVRGDSTLLDATPEEAEALQSIDLEQLERAARLACDGILRRSHRGSGSLLDAFARTLATWRSNVPNASLEELADTFAESTHFMQCQTLPTCNASTSLEEAFFRYAEEADLGDPATRKAEVVCALVRALVVTPHPSFALPAFIRRAPRGYFSILPGPELVAAIEGRLLRGRITPLLSALLDRHEAFEQVAERFGVSVEVVATSHAELRRLGLL